MKIPKSFYLNGQVVDIIFDDEQMHKEGLLGLCVSDQNKIFLTRTIIEGKKKIKLPKEKVQQVALHEIVHAMLDSMGEHKLSKNEKFVDQMANCFYQYLTTKV